jgi:hypothetical protein
MRVDLFLDFSNLFRGAEQYYAPRMTVDFTALLGLGLAVGGEIRRAVAVVRAPVSPWETALVNALASTGWQVRTVDSPQDEDEALKEAIRESLKDPPEVIVLLSGDHGFLPVLQEASEQGVQVLVGGIAGTIHASYFREGLEILLLDDLILYPRNLLRLRGHALSRRIRRWPGKHRERLEELASEQELEAILADPDCPFADLEGLRLWWKCWRLGLAADPQMARQIHRALRGFDHSFFFQPSRRLQTPEQAPERISVQTHGARAQPAPGPSGSPQRQPAPRGSRWKITAAIAIGLLILLGLCLCGSLFWLFGGRAPTVTPTPSRAASTSSRNPTGTPSPTATSRKAESVLGQGVRYGELLVTPAEYRFLEKYRNSWGSTVEPPRGARFLWVRIVVENVGGYPAETPLYHQFQIIYRNEYFYDASRYNDNPQMPDLPWERIYPGARVEGWLMFTVPKQAGPEDFKLVFRSPLHYEIAIWRLTP